MKSGNLNFLELSGPLQACNGTALPIYSYVREGPAQAVTVYTYDQLCITYEGVQLISKLQHNGI
jgi:hypothetical protein